MALRIGANTLRLHIAHPLGRCTGAVRDLADALHGLGGGAASVSYSADLPLDQQWHARAREVVRSAQWLLLMFGERSLDRDWWLWEAGYFAAIHPTPPNRMVCLHHPSLKVPRVLHAWRTVPATIAHADELLREILDSHSNPTGRSLLSSVEGKSAEGRSLGWLSECLVHCCIPASPQPVIDPAHAG